MLRRQELELDRCLRARRPMGPEVDVPEGSGAELLSDEEFPIPHILDTTYVGIHRFLGKDKEGFKKIENLFSRTNEKNSGKPFTTCSHSL